MKRPLIILVMFLVSCGISPRDVEATIAAFSSATPSSTNTPIEYEVVFEVRSTLVNAIFYDDLWEISWGKNYSNSSSTYTAQDVYGHNWDSPGYRVHWTETIEAKSGDTVFLSIQGYPETPSADCAIVVSGEDVSFATKGNGGGGAVCVYIIP